MPDGVREGQDAPLALGLVAHIRALLAHSHHHALVSGSPDDGQERSSGGTIPSKACLAHLGAIVDGERSDLFHCGG